MANEIVAPIDALRKRGHCVDEPYIRDGKLFVVVDGMAMLPHTAVALAQGTLTLQEITDPRDGSQSQG